MIWPTTLAIKVSNPKKNPDAHMAGLRTQGHTAVTRGKEIQALELQFVNHCFLSGIFAGMARVVGAFGAGPHGSHSTLRTLDVFTRQKHVKAKACQISPNARRQAQCKGGGKKKCQILHNIQASRTEPRKNHCMEHESKKHCNRESHRAAFLATISQLPLQNISNYVSKVTKHWPFNTVCVLSACYQHRSVATNSWFKVWWGN